MQEGLEKARAALLEVPAGAPAARARRPERDASGHSRAQTRRTRARAATRRTATATTKRLQSVRAARAAAAALRRATTDAGYTLGLELRAEGEEGDAFAAALYANRAECARQLGVPREVVADCSAALRLAPRHEKALLRRAAALEATERFAAAAEDYEALAALGGAGERAAREGARRGRSAAAACERQ